MLSTEICDKAEKAKHCIQRTIQECGTVLMPGPGMTFLVSVQMKASLSAKQRQPCHVDDPREFTGWINREVRSAPQAFSNVLPWLPGVSRLVQVRPQAKLSTGGSPARYRVPSFTYCALLAGVRQNGIKF